MVWLLTLLAAPAAKAAPSVTFECTPAPQDCSGWYRSNVTVDWTVVPTDGSVVTGCQDATLTADTPGTTESCSADDGSATVTVQLKIRVDQTPPVVTGGQARAADAGGWYNHAVGVTFAGSDLTSGIGSCTSTTYDGPDSAAASIAGTCVDQAGNVSAPLSYGLKYDATAPTVAAAQPQRSANVNGWFVSPVRFSFTGTDATSGLDVCPPVDYTGPDGAGALLVGRCRDRAGNTGTRNFTLDYDATPPALSLSAQSGDGSVALSWQTSPDATSVTVVRTPGVGGRPSSVVFTGPGTSFVDGLVDNGTRYAYDVNVADAAGNASTQRVVGLPSARLLVSSSAVPGVIAVPESGTPVASPPKRRAISPAAGSVFQAAAPPLLRWPTARRASYYNVQLFRGKRKLLSVWPARPRYQLARRWKFGGKPRRLVAGTYRWMVWPGYGRRSKGRYGKRIVRSTFVIQKVPRLSWTESDRTGR